METSLSDVSWEEICETLDISLSPPNAIRRKNGVIYLLCPFHVEKTPSLKFWEKTNTFLCFGCHYRGNKEDFISLYTNTTFYIGDNIDLEKIKEIARSRRFDPDQQHFPFWDEMINK